MNELVICRHRPGAGEGVTTVLTIGQDGSVIGTDINLSLVLGYSAGDIEGRPLQTLIASAEDNPLCPDYASYHESGRPLTVTLRHSRGYFLAARVVVRPAPVTKEKPPIQKPLVVPKASRATGPDAGQTSSREDIARTKALLAHIRTSLASGGLPLDFQLMEASQDKNGPLCIEILARLRGPSADDSAPLTPAEFLPLIERFELSRRLDRQVIKQVLCHLHVNPHIAGRLGYCGFNLSLGSLQDRTFPAFIARALEKTGLDPSTLCFEIPAHHAVAFTADCRHTCRMLKQLGCRTALDGAGTTMDSYRLAGRLPVDFIKLAPALMKELHEEPTHLVMIEALQRIASTTGKITVATSVENDIVWRRAQGLGVHYVQGRIVGEPRPLTELGKGNRGPKSAGAIA
ncbi:EAL domain, c-di-GMP-specific phosphodiesterase class I (or its enzymatically inactive variant) [Marinobacter daqiaonensis]|uniref:EAL domain, c-di-GMP-specific phosphodiesterase class I (Or its enzymatically inactive variant) n=1 Tax=Marinobacter daqiaonensis TaxID=650891 RepID=A0A1I6JU36_9GAMM|nr:EAL domain-containing protein [Marinobacter daqiaonensis]SFR82504.1 EAL domain, c-di-GMP-specific phosphodiesterase class I (or its enzymatically inactive variant) [Marinobacter daqiaonensis]